MSSSRAQQVPNPTSRVPSGWEKPPGLGTATMSTVFEACKELYDWLALDEDNVAVCDLLACCMSRACHSIMHLENQQHQESQLFH